MYKRIRMDNEGSWIDAVNYQNLSKFFSPRRCYRLRGHGLVRVSRLVVLGDPSRPDLTALHSVTTVNESEENYSSWK